MGRGRDVTAAQIIIALLCVIAALMAVLVVRVIRAVNTLTGERIRVYGSHLTELHAALDELRHGRPRPPLDDDQTLNVIASFPVMQSSARAMEAIMAVDTARRDGASSATVTAAEDEADATLVELSVAMRADFALNAGEGQFPGAVLFRQRRGRSA